MTDHKSWLWRKKSSDKTIIVAEKDVLASREHVEEIQALLAEKAQLERDVLELDGKLSSALSECNAKDDTVKKHAKTAKEALAGWEKAEAKSLSLKQELDEAVKQRDICEERTRHLDSALKECMQQLRFVREEKEQRIHDVLLKASEQLEETKMFFEEKLEESGKNIAKYCVENSELCKMIFLKEQLVEDLSQQMAKAEEHINALLAKLKNVEKDNNTLRYEVRVLEKEVDIRNEEKEFNRRTSDATQKQHLENVKKIAKLESECQRLRVLVKKRLPSPADMAKMKSEVGMLPRRKSNLNVSQSDYELEKYPESPGKKNNLLSDRIFALEDENHLMRETLQKSLNELQVSRNMYLQTAIKLSQVEAQLEELPKHHLIKDIRSIRLSHDLSLASMSDFGSDDKVSCAGSWASPCKSVAMSDINQFMDDFADMEKLALVCVDKTTVKSSDINSFSESTGKELVPVSGVVDIEKQELKDQSETQEDREALKKQLENSESSIASLQVELESLKQSKAVIEDQFENNVMMIEDLNVQLLAVKCQMQEAHKKFAALEGELMSKVNRCEDLEVKCLDLEVQLESATKMDTSHHPDQDKKKLETEWEISAASEKLAECQETILHLGKQLQAMTKSRHVMGPDKFMATPTDSNNATSVHATSQRSSLFDHMQADDDPGLDQHDQSPETKEIISAKEYSSIGPLAIVPIKKQQNKISGGLFKKLLWRKKKSSRKMMQLPFAS